MVLYRLTRACRRGNARTVTKREPISYKELVQLAGSFLLANEWRLRAIRHAFFQRKKRVSYVHFVFLHAVVYTGRHKRNCARDERYPFSGDI